MKPWRRRVGDGLWYSSGCTVSQTEPGPFTATLTWTRSSVERIVLWKTELEGLVRLVSSLGGPEYIPGDYGDYLQVYVLSTESDIFFVTTRPCAAM